MRASRPRRRGRGLRSAPARVTSAEREREDDRPGEDHEHRRRQVQRRLQRRPSVDGLRLPQGLGLARAAMWPWYQRVRCRTSPLTVSTPCCETQARGAQSSSQPRSVSSSPRSRSSVSAFDHGAATDLRRAARRVNWPFPPRQTERVRMRAICAIADIPQNSRSCIRPRNSRGCGSAPGAGRRRPRAVEPGEHLVHRVRGEPSVRVHHADDRLGRLEAALLRDLEQRRVASVEGRSLALAGVGQRAPDDVGTGGRGDPGGRVGAPVVDDDDE